MARLVQLGALITDLRAEIGQSQSTALGINYKPVLVRALQSAQNFLDIDHVWPFLRVFADKSMAAGSRYYDLPTNLAFDRITEVRFLWNDIWSQDPLPFGIGLQDYNMYNSDLDVRQDPVQKWDLRDTGTSLQFEVWPLPFSNSTNSLRFIGKRALRAFQNDSDLCDLDSELLIQWAATGLQPKDSPAAMQAQKKALATYMRLKGNSGQANNNRYSFADSAYKEPRTRTPIVTWAR